MSISRRDLALSVVAGVLPAVALPRVARGQQSTLRPTGQETLGPFYPVRAPASHELDLTHYPGRNERAQGQVIELTGRVLDTAGRPLPQVTMTIWQANAAGRYTNPVDTNTAPLDPNFQGFASLKSDANGAWRIVTIKPGGYDSPIGRRPPHIHFDVRGRQHRNVAQLYFPEEAANAADSLYRALGAAAATSVAVRDEARPGKYVWDIVLLG